MTGNTSGSSSSKERLTIDWFTQAIAEIRGELAELQEASSNTSRHLQARNQCAENIAELRDDFAKLKLEFGAMRMRQDTIDQAIKDLQAETIQRDEDFRHIQSQVRSQLPPHCQPYRCLLYSTCKIRWKKEEELTECNCRSLTAKLTFQTKCEFKFNKTRQHNCVYFLFGWNEPKTT